MRFLKTTNKKNEVSFILHKCPEPGKNFEHSSETTVYIFTWHFQKANTIGGFDTNDEYSYSSTYQWTDGIVAKIWKESCLLALLDRSVNHSIGKLLNFTI